MNPIEKIIISIKNGLASYKKLTNMVGIVLGGLSLGNLIIELFTIKMNVFLGKLYLGYQALVYPIPTFLFQLFSIKVPNYIIDLLTIYLILGASVGRVQLNYYIGNPRVIQKEYICNGILGRDRKNFLTIRSFKFLFIRKSQFKLGNLKETKVSLMYRLEMMYRFLPETYKFIFDLLLWPILSFPELIKYPIEAYHTNNNNPEDNGIYRYDTATTVPNTIMWTEDKFIRDLRILFLTQIFLIITTVLLSLLLNVIIIKL